MELDKEQQVVVDSNESMVCIAGPGSGKTRVLTSKARRLLNEGRNVICLCFTRAAAAEMSSRVPNLPATTIHSYCCQYVGWQVPRGGSNDDGYQYLLHRFLLENEFRFDWVLVDECQDLNPEEMDVVFNMIGDKVFAVGDPYQSIYGFQGAMGPNVIELLKRCGCNEAPLRNNYRSCPEVVNRLNEMYNRDLISKGVKDTGLTAILCRRNDDVFEVSNFLKRRTISHRIRLSAMLSKEREWDVSGQSNLRLMTVHSSKGHEFDRVLLYNWLPDNYEEESRVHYVAVARASKEYKWVGNLNQLEETINSGS